MSDTGLSFSSESGPDNIRLLVAEGRPIVQQGLFSFIGDWPDIELVAVADDSQRMLSLVRPAAPDVVLVSTSTRGRGFFDTLRRVCTAHPELPVIVMSENPEPSYATRAFRIGACAYLSNDATADDLHAAIRSAQRGENYVSRSLGDVSSYLRGSAVDAPEHSLLSNREYEVLCMMGAGKSVSTIAPELGLSSKTVSTYRSRLLRKLNLSSSAEIIRYAIEHDLVGEASHI